MFDQYLEQLSSPDATQRREAIIALGKSGDTRALSPLANIYKSDPDPGLRELALKAGRYLKGTTASVPGVAAVSSTTSVPSPVTQVAKPEPKPRELSYADRQKAKNRLDMAIGLVAQGNNERALTELVDAIRINPELAKDTVALNLASTVTGTLSTSEAMEIIVKEAQEPAKRKRTTTSAETVESGDNDNIILLISLLIMFILTAISIVLLRAGTLNALQVVYKISPPRPSESFQYQQLLSEFGSLSPGALLFATLLQIVGLLVDVGILYGVGSLMGGTAAISRFFSRLVRVQIVMTILLLIESAILFFGVFRTTTPAREIFPAMQGVLSLLGLTSFAYLVWEGIAVARSHNISVFRGCLTRVISIVLSGVLFFIILLVIGSAVPRPTP
jgi:hypothetical protein